ncbi:hypothetical protein MRB53_000817 [Persea americana]|uniref:Uncharacterized protein n=1 Tax=Persea americana TaxID=3435 RepID=A0ACC2MQ35_PERAE|nr:hypothetical protein MRB53_000817 [Persea americana]
MDEKFEALSSILHGCELAKQLQTNLPTLANQPNSLLSSCEEITRAFNKAMILLNPQHPAAYSHQIFEGPSESSSRAQHMERGGYTQAMDIFYAHALGRNPFDVRLLPEGSMVATEHLSVAPVVELATKMLQVNAGEAEASGRPRPIGEFQASDTSDSGGSSMGGMPLQRPRRRRDSRDVRTIRVSAPRTGNVEIPPDDGYTWRKYGQKEILKSKFPRSYYRCTHKSFYGCDAKKQVQRLDDDPYTFEVMYRGHHTCQTSTTPLILTTQDTRSAEALETTRPQTSLGVSTSIQLAPFFPREVEVGPKDKNTLINFPDVCSGVQGESSHVQVGKDLDFPVADFAAAMFDPRSTSDDIDAIFSTKKEH